MNATDSATNWTLLKLLNWTCEYFEKAGIEDARLNAELLLSEATGLDRIMLYARFEEQVSPQTRARYRRMVRKRAERCPLQYVLGYAEFYGRKFHIDPSVLIPRPETELLVEKCLECLPPAPREVLAADIGTGSGVIAITLACEREDLSCYATDIREDPVEVARANARRHGVEERMAFYTGHLFDALPAEAGRGSRRLDLIASNPPYIPTGDIEGLQPEVSRWEPAVALDGGRTGLGVTRALIETAADALRPGGWLVIELGEGQSEHVRAMVKNLPQWCYESMDFRKDANGCERILSVRSARPAGEKQIQSQQFQTLSLDLQNV